MERETVPGTDLTHEELERFQAGEGDVPRACAGATERALRMDQIGQQMIGKALAQPRRTLPESPAASQLAMTTPDFEKVAREITNAQSRGMLESHGPGICSVMNHDAMTTAIASAIRSVATPPEGCVRDDKGVDRKVLGTLPLTADGCVVANGAQVFAIGEDHGDCGLGGPIRIAHVGNIFAHNDEIMAVDRWPREWPIENVYSTREAALAAHRAASGEPPRAGGE